MSSHRVTWRSLQATFISVVSAVEERRLRTNTHQPVRNKRQTDGKEMQRQSPSYLGVVTFTVALNKQQRQGYVHRTLCG
jgi:hypothetical protein